MAKFLGLSESEPPVLYAARSYFFLSRRTYDGAPDAQRFLMVTRADGTRGDTPMRMHLIENWFEELRERVPTDVK